MQPIEWLLCGNVRTKFLNDCFEDNTDIGYVDKLAGKVTYTELTTLATELCRTVCNDQLVACENHTKLKKWIDVSHLRLNV